MTRAIIGAINNVYTPQAGRCGLDMQVLYVADDQTVNPTIGANVQAEFAWGSTATQIRNAIAAAIVAKGNDLGLAVGAGAIIGPSYALFN